MIQTSGGLNRQPFGYHTCLLTSRIQQRYGNIHVYAEYANLPFFKGRNEFASMLLQIQPIQLTKTRENGEIRAASVPHTHLDGEIRSVVQIHPQNILI